MNAFGALSDKPQAPAANAQDLQRFCEILVDYVSAGHFEVYEQLTAEGKAFGDQRGLAYLKQSLLEPSANVPEGHVVVTARPTMAVAMARRRVRGSTVMGVSVRLMPVGRCVSPLLTARARKLGNNANRL